MHFFHFQRFDYNVLTPFLPPKHEFVISVGLSDLQAKLYEHYIKTFSRISGSGENRRLFKDYQIMRLIWTHPFAMNKSFEKRMVNLTLKFIFLPNNVCKNRYYFVI